MLTARTLAAASRGVFASGFAFVVLFAFYQESNRLASDSTGKFSGKAHESNGVNFAPYMESVQDAVRPYWHPPHLDSSKQVVVHFAVKRNGSVSRLRIEKSSGVDAMDAAALAAVKNAAPFAALPSGSPSSVEVEFRLDYNVYCLSN